VNRARPIRRDATGITLVEVAVALSVLLLLSALIAGLLGDAASGSHTVTSRLEVVEARRITRDLVDHGIRAGGASAVDSRGLRVRNFVGHAEACGGGVLAYRGRRRPDPSRDSVWILRADGTQLVTPLEPIRWSPCPSPATGAEGLVLSWPAVDPRLPAPALVRIFEFGRYTVSDALRYGRAGSPAQPLTAPVLEATASGIQAVAGGVQVEVTGQTDTTGIARRWRIR